VRVDDRPIEFVDQVHGLQSWRLDQVCGDFVIRRADGLAAYQLAVTVDDAWQQVTEVVRGTDLLDSTPRQVHLQQLLGYPRPSYLHLPLAVDVEGRKLSKRLRSDPVGHLEPLDAMRAALRCLGLAPPPGGGVDAMLAWAREHWNPAGVPRGQVVLGADVS
jgi:glutamyl-Q tRNA(Asp) synthetase